MTILVIYGQTGYPLRASIKEHLQCFEKSGTKVYYFNASIGKFPDRIDPSQFDLVIFHHLFLSDRWTGGNIDFFDNVVLGNVQTFKNASVKKILLVQDDYFHSDAVCRFVNVFGISELFSVAPSSEWEKIYGAVDKKKTRLHHTLTGYVSGGLRDKISAIGRENIRRDIDIGYRAYKAPPWFGRFGFLKTAIAELFINKAPQAGFSTNISIEQKDTIFGDDWYRFLFRCRFVIGVEGGSSILDRDGSIWYKCDEYIRENPDWKFSEVETLFFQERDGEIALKALSPRHLEACLTKTCQVLVKGNYNGILKAWEHYIPLEPDFSNLEEVFSAMKDDALCRSITESAYLAGIDPENSYSHFTSEVLSGTDKQRTRRKATLKTHLWLTWLNVFHPAINRYQHTGKHTVSTFIYSILVKIYVFLRPRAKKGPGMKKCVE